MAEEIFSTVDFYNVFLPWLQEKASVKNNDMEMLYGYLWTKDDGKTVRALMKKCKAEKEQENKEHIIDDKLNKVNKDFE